MKTMKEKKKLRKAPVILGVSALALTLTVPVLAALKGDVNGDGKLGIADVVMLCKHLVTEGDLTDASAADYNDDSQITAADLTSIKRAVMESTKPVQTGQSAAIITFSDKSAALKNADGGEIAAADNVTVTDDTIVTITQPCELDIDGECTNGQICVNVDKTTYPDAQVTLNLRGLTLSNANDSPIYVASVADECVITVKKDTVNTITDGKEYQNADGDSGAIYSCDDLKFKGKGTLIVNGQCTDGIVSKDDIKIWNGDIQVNALDDGIRGKDSVRIGDPDAKEGYDDLKLTVKTEQGDGIKSTSTTTEKTDGTAVNQGFVRINGGMVNIDSYLDGIQGEQSVEINGGDITIKTYTGSTFTGSNTGGQQQGGWGGFGGGGGFGFGGMNDGNPNKTDVSAKGIKAVGIFDEAGTTWQSGGDITVTGGHITVDSSDDAIHCGGSMTLTGGIFNIASADDGFHSDHDLTIGTENAGTYDDVQIYVSKGYEGIEGVNIYQNSGTVYVVTTDDGYNAAGGADSSGQGGGNPWGGGFMSSTYGELWLRGGLVVVNSANGDHDGFDSNGPINISGGYYFCNGQEPVDCGDGYSITQTGGTYVTMTAGNTNLGTTYTVKDASGNAVATFKWAGGSAGISSKDNSTAYSGTTVSGGTEILSDCPYGVTLGGTVSGGTQITAAASSGGMGGPGGGPGGRRRPDEIGQDDTTDDEMAPDDMPFDEMNPGMMPPDGMKPGKMPPDGMKPRGNASDALSAW